MKNYNKMEVETYEFYYLNSFEYVPNGISINSVEYLITTDEDSKKDIALALREDNARLIAEAARQILERINGKEDNA